VFPLNRAWMVACVLGWGALVAEPAVAQTTEGCTEGEARPLFEAGRAAYDEARYESALQYFRRAYELCPERPALLYNIGTTADRLRLDDEAREAYRQYLERLPNAPNRSAAESRLQFLEQQSRTEPTPPDPTPVPDVEPQLPPPAEREGATPPPQPVADAVVAGPGDDGESGPGFAPWLVVGAGGALAVTGVILVAVALGDRSTVEDTPDGSRWVDIEGAYDAVGPTSTAGFLLLGVGVAAAAGGLAWWLAGSGSSSESSVNVAVGPGGLVTTGVF